MWGWSAKTAGSAPNRPAIVAMAPSRSSVSREWHEREARTLWRTAWQFACRTDDIAEVGDHVLYEVVRDSYIVIRTAPDEIKAYPNACLHRGRRLKEYAGRCSEIRCPFHGFTWTLDGALKHVPARWDFEQIRDDEFSLPECRVGTWAGFVMINPDPGAEPLEDFLGEIVEQFEVWDLADRYTQAHVAKVIHANWKIAQEAFCEALHVNATHPQIAPYLGDTNTQVDIWENFARAITPGGTPSPVLEWTPTQDEMMRAMTDTRVDEPTPLPVSEDESMRAAGAAASRDRWRPVAGEWVDRMSDAEMMDSIDYTVFPNFHPWGAFNRIVYRFRPNGDDHRSSLMECIFLAPFSGDKPAGAPVDRGALRAGRDRQPAGDRRRPSGPVPARRVVDLRRAAGVRPAVVRLGRRAEGGPSPDSGGLRRPLRRPDGWAKTRPDGLPTGRGP